MTTKRALATISAPAYRPSSYIVKNPTSSAQRQTILSRNNAV